MRKLKPSPNEPVGELKRVLIRECGEALVDFCEACPGLLLTSPVFGYQRATLVRATVAEMLNRALRFLPKGYRLGIIEGWRPIYVQRRMYLTSMMRFQNLHPEWNEATLTRTTNRFTHPPGAAAPPPHSSGGAVDVMLVDGNGERLDHHTPYAPFDRRSFPSYAKGLSETARRHRAILSEALLAAGMTNYPSEYWHWSYGDQGWAYRGPDQAAEIPKDEFLRSHEWKPYAIYGPIVAPPGWTPCAEDDIDEPLERLWAGGEGSGFPTKGQSETGS